jgi:hypothetical protein
MRMKDEVCCRDQVQRGCDLCQQYRRQPNIELDDFCKFVIKNMPLEHRCEAYVMLETVLRYGRGVFAYSFTKTLKGTSPYLTLNLLAASEMDAAVFLSLRRGNAP